MRKRNQALGEVIEAEAVRLRRRRVNPNGQRRGPEREAAVGQASEPAVPHSCWLRDSVRNRSIPALDHGRAILGAPGLAVWLAACFRLGGHGL